MLIEKEGVVNMSEEQNKLEGHCLPDYQYVIRLEAKIILRLQTDESNFQRSYEEQEELQNWHLLTVLA